MPESFCRLAAAYLGLRLGLSVSTCAPRTIYFRVGFVVPFLAGRTSFAVALLKSMDEFR